MNRSKLLFVAALVAAIVVACNTDRPTSQNNGIERIPVATENITTSGKTFKIRVNGTTYALWRVGDYLAVDTGSNKNHGTYKIRSGGVVHRYITPQSITVTWNGLGSPWKLDYFQNCAVDEPGICGASDSSSEFIVQVPAPASGFNIATIDLSNGYRDSLVLSSVDNDSTIFKGYLLGTTYTPSILTMNQIPVTDTGGFQYEACSSAPTCSFALPAPTSVTLTNVVQYAKITWNNNGDSQDSTEVWFGDVGNPTLQAVVVPGTTQYFAQWLSGSHQYIGKVRHRWNGNISSLVSSNTITR